jgi:hypothetical protein
MGTCCQAGERGEKLTRLRVASARRGAKGRGQKPEDGGEFTSILWPEGGFLSLSLRR